MTDITLQDPAPTSADPTARNAVENVEARA